MTEEPDDFEFATQKDGTSEAAERIAGVTNKHVRHGSIKSTDNRLILEGKGQIRQPFTDMIDYDRLRF